MLCHVVVQDAELHHHLQSRKDLELHDIYDGVLELGGASFQITFLSEEEDKARSMHSMDSDRAELLQGSDVDFEEEQQDDETDHPQHQPALHMPGVSKPLFTHSFLGFGMDSALRTAEEVVLQSAPTNNDETRKDILGGKQLHAVIKDPCLPIG